MALPFKAAATSLFILTGAVAPASALSPGEATAAKCIGYLNRSTQLLAESKVTDDDFRRCLAQPSCNAIWPQHVQQSQGRQQSMAFLRTWLGGVDRRRPDIGDIVRQSSAGESDARLTAAMGWIPDYAAVCDTASALESLLAAGRR